MNKIDTYEVIMISLHVPVKRYHITSQVAISNIKIMKTSQDTEGNPRSANACQKSHKGFQR